MMPRSKIFYTDTYKELEEKTKIFLNGQDQFLSDRTAHSPRAVGDAIEDILAEGFGTVLGNLAQEYSSKFARRAMEDIVFTDKDDFYYVVDVKTHRLDASLSMPNLISVKRLSRFYEEDKNYFVVLKVNYRVEDLKVVIDSVTFVPLEFLSWDCLTLGALGWGQIQIKDAKTVTILPKNERKSWMIEMCDNLLDFYPKEILKINDRISYFEKVKKYWQER